VEQSKRQTTNELLLSPRKKTHITASELFVNASELRTLLQQSESETLDFKSKQYLFAGATDEDKSELLKDIVSMANACKSSDGYILVGVEEKHERVNGLCGADASLADSHVQQFVNSKTNRPISFLVEIFSHEGVDLTIIHIGKKQKRPLYLLKDFGRLHKEVVYIRRGSSTDTASPDEIAEMGREAAQVARPDVSLEFEFSIEELEDQRFGVDYPPVRKPKIRTEVFLIVYAVNHKGGIAEHVEGSVWVPTLILMEALIEHRIPSRARTLQEIAECEPYEIEITNNFPGVTQQFMKPRQPEWHPFSPGKRIRLKSLPILPDRELLNGIACSIRWQISVNGSDVIKGETKFADIPVIDR
jgi:hypothetical protein